MAKQIEEIKFVSNGKTYKLVDAQARKDLNSLSVQIDGMDFSNHYTKQEIDIKIASAFATTQLEGSNATVSLAGYYDKAGTNSAIEEYKNNLKVGMCYENLTGVYDSNNAVVNYTHPYLSAKDISDGTKVLMHGANNPPIPETECTIYKNVAAFDTNSAGFKFMFPEGGYGTRIESIGKDGDVLIYGGSLKSDKMGTFVRCTKEGTILSADGLVSSEYYPLYAVKSISLSNGGVFIIGTYENDNTYRADAKYCYVKPNENTGSPSTISNLTYPTALQLSNGNVIIAGHDYGAGKFIIKDIINGGENIVQETALSSGSDFYYVEMIQLTNKNIVFVGTDNGTNLGLAIFSEDGELIKSRTTIATAGFKKWFNLHQMSSGDIVICGIDEDYADYMNYMVVDENGNVLKEPEKITNAYHSAPIDPMIMSLDNGDTMLISNCLNTDGTCMIIIDSNTFEIKKKTNLNYFYYPSVTKMNGGHIIVIGSYNSCGAYAIVDQNGDIIKGITTLNEMASYSSRINSIVLANDNILITGTNDSNSYAGYYEIIKPTADGVSYTFALNTKEIDSSIEKDKYYELLYNSAQGK